tara:strand:- start:121 stop:627 length:507 start_codon:yes stop_codon:yes gene_type:complete
MSKKTLQKLQYEFDGLLKGVKRAEQLKGLKSKYAPVFKARGMKGLKAGGPVIKRKGGEKIGTPKVKKIMPDDSFMKGLSQDAIDDILGRPKRDASGVKRSSKKKKGNTKVSLKIKKMGGGSLKDIPAGNKGLSKLPKNVRKEMGFKKAGGKITYRMSGGKVVSIGYDD